LEHRAGIEPANTDFADQRVSHFATGAHPAPDSEEICLPLLSIGLKLKIAHNKNPTSLNWRVGHLSFDSNALNLSLRSRPRKAAATAAAGTGRDECGHFHRILDLSILAMKRKHHPPHRLLVD
jgi:hypothetical protein